MFYTGTSESYNTFTRDAPQGPLPISPRMGTAQKKCQTLEESSLLAMMEVWCHVCPERGIFSYFLHLEGTFILSWTQKPLRRSWGFWSSFFIQADVALDKHSVDYSVFSTLGINKKLQNRWGKINLGPLFRTLSSGRHHCSALPHCSPWGGGPAYLVLLDSLVHLHFLGSLGYLGALVHQGFQEGLVSPAPQEVLGWSGLMRSGCESGWGWLCTWPCDLRQEGQRQLSINCHTKGGLEVYLSRLRTTLLDAHQRGKHTPLKHADFRFKTFYISLWMLWPAGVYSSRVSCVWNSTAHISISQISFEQRSRILSFPQHLSDPLNPHPAAPFLQQFLHELSFFQPTMSAPPSCSQIYRQVLFRFISLLPSVCAVTFTWVPAADTPTSFIFFKSGFLSHSHLIRLLLEGYILIIRSIDLYNAYYHNASFF